MASGIFNRFKYNLKTKQIDMVNDVIKVMLLANTYTFDADHDILSDVSTHEINPGTGNGYTDGGATLANKSVTQDDTNDNAKFDADDTVWSSATFTARYAVIYDDTVANDPLIGVVDFGSDKSVTADDFTIQWHANGIMTLA